MGTEDGSTDSDYTFINKLLIYSSKPSILHYMLNNAYLNKKLFCKACKRSLNKFDHKVLCRFGSLISYLTRISLKKFKGFYNIEKYYDMIYTMLLIIKVQQRLPVTIIKHLIIPFVYQ